MPSVRLYDVVSGITDSTGALTIIYNGPKPGSIYILDRMSILMPETIKIPTFVLYKGFVSPANFLTGSSTGQRDTDDLPQVTLHPGEFLTGIWSKATALVRASLTIEGTNRYGLP